MRWLVKLRIKLRAQGTLPNLNIGSPPKDFTLGSWLAMTPLWFSSNRSIRYVTTYNNIREEIIGKWWSNCLQHVADSSQTPQFINFVYFLSTLTVKLQIPIWDSAKSELCYYIPVSNMSHTGIGRIPTLTAVTSVAGDLGPAGSRPE